MTPSPRTSSPCLRALGLRSSALLLGAALALCGTFASPSAAHATTLRLRSGAVLHGEIVSADEERLQFRRWDNGGLVELTWAHLLPADAARLQAIHLGEGLEDEMADAVRLTLRDGRELVGRLVEDRPDRVRILLNLQDPPSTLSAASIVRRDPARVKAVLLTPAQELYDARARAAEPKSAQSQFDLGLACLRLRLYDKAKEHLQRSAELDPLFKDRAEAKLALGAREKAEEGARRELEKLEKALAVQKFDDARAALARLKDEYKNARSARGAAELEARIAAEEKSYVGDKKQFLDNKLLSDWWDAARSLLRKASSKRELELAKAKAYVDAILDTEVKESLARSMNLDPKDLEERWNQRKPTATKTATYGESTWLVDAGPRKKAGADAKSLEEFLNEGDLDKIIDQLRQSAKKNTAAAQEEWWKVASSEKRQAFLEAYAAEKFGKEVELKSQPCATCQGKGLVAGNAELCRRCVGARRDRVVVFR
ncbi:MAG: hypothetical protein HYZ53_01945 [Planctomycetes bacterium]|nr:hypothetical protein [Planctomycetota bacterium]